MSRNAPNPSGAPSLRSRYPGTRPFSDSPDDRTRFFGRTAESEQLYLRVLSVPFLVQFAKSGLGKTSLLQASLFPRLRQKPFLPVMIRLNIFGETLAQSVARSIQQACEAERLEYTPGRADSLWELLSTTTVWRDDLLLTPVLAFDQFEEVFSLREAAFRESLAAALGALASGHTPERPQVGRPAGVAQPGARPSAKIVISLREDYLGALEEFSAAIPGLFHERLRLGPLTEEGAREAITGPAQLVAAAGEEPYWSPRFEFAPAALESMIGYLKGSFAVIEPFQLQLLCRHAEAIAREKVRKPDAWVELTPADFMGSHDFASVLQDFYRNTLRKLPGEQRRKAQELCEEGLLDASGHRLMLEERQIRSDFKIDQETLAILSQDRLLRRERRLESAFYEISHDRLAESILKSKRFRLPKKMRRVLWSTAIMAPFVLAAGVYWIHSLRQARRHAEDERQKAERFISFLLGEKFLGEVRDTGSSRMLELVREQAEDCEGPGHQQMAAICGLALRNAGDLKRTGGTLEEAVARFREALKVIEGNSDRFDTREVARTRERLGEALAEQGRVSEALSHYQAAVGAWREVVRMPGAPAETSANCASLADSLLSTGELENRSGQMNAARKDVHEALAIASAMLFRRQTSKEECGGVAGPVEPYLDAKALVVFSRAVLSQANMLSFAEDYDGPAGLAERARWLRPQSISARRSALEARAWRGHGQRATRPEAALADYRITLAELEELSRGDPSNRLWQRDRAATQLLVGEGMLACLDSKTRNCKPMPSVQDAEATILEAIATLRALAQQDPGNTSLQEDLAWGLQERARVLASLKRQPERLAALEESERIYALIKLDDKDADGASGRASLLVDKADALAALGRQVEAGATLQRSIDLFKRLVAVHPDNLNYVWNLGDVYQREAQMRGKAGPAAAANAARRRAKELKEQYQKAIEGINQEAYRLDTLATTQVNEGARLFKAADYAAALREFNAAESSMREYISLKPALAAGHDDLRLVYTWIGLANEKLGDVVGQGAALMAAMEAAQVAVLLESENSDSAMNVHLYDARKDLGIFLDNHARSEEALAVAEEGVVVAETLWRAAEQHGQHTDYAGYLYRLGNAKCGLGQVRRNLGRHGWREAISSGLIHIQKAADIDPRNPAYFNELNSWREYLASQSADPGLREIPAVPNALP